MALGLAFFFFLYYTTCYDGRYLDHLRSCEKLEKDCMMEMKHLYAYALKTLSARPNAVPHETIPLMF